MMLIKNLIPQIKIWVGRIHSTYSKKMKMELLVEKQYYISYRFETKHYWAKLVVSQIGHYVEFVAYELNKENTSSGVYYYHDNEENIEDNIFDYLNEGIAYILN